MAGLFLYRRQQRIRLALEKLAKEREEILNANNLSGRTAKNFSGRELNLLGVDGFGEVYKGVLADGTVVAVKCAKLDNAKSMDQILNEVCVLSQSSVVINGRWRITPRQVQDAAAVEPMSTFIV